MEVTQLHVHSYDLRVVGYYRPNVPIVVVNEQSNRERLKEDARRCIDIGKRLAGRSNDNKERV